MSNNRFASLKTKPTNTFKSGSGRSRPSLNNGSKKGFGSYKSDLDNAFSSNKKNKYVPPAKRNRKNSGSRFSRSSSESKPAFIPTPSFKEKEGDFPTLGEDAFPTLGAEPENNESGKVSFANLVKNVEKPVVEKKPEIDAVKPGWIRWRKDPETNKWIVERGPESKEHKRFMKWMNEFTAYRKQMAFYDYLDRMEQKELEELELNGPEYIHSWEYDSMVKYAKEYDSGPDEQEDSSTDSEESEYYEDNEFPTSKRY